MLCLAMANLSGYPRETWLVHLNPGLDEMECMIFKHSISL
jgi:hypothetical protein